MSHTPRVTRGLAVVVAALVLAERAAFAVLLVDQALTDTSQILSVTNNPYFGAGNTANLAAVNISYGTPVGTATLNGIGFHDLDLQSNPRTGSGIPVAYALPGVTMDFTFDGDADMPGSRNLTSVSLTGPDAAVGDQVALGNRYISVTTNHRPNLLTFHGAQASQPVYVQLIGGQHGWNGDTSIYVNGDGVTEGSGTLVGTWDSNKTNKTAGLAAFEATTNASGDLAMEVQSAFFSGLAAVIVQAQQAPPGPVVRDGVPNPDYPTFKLWFDASDSATLSLNGSSVAQWNDKTAVANNASQATASRQPVLVSNAINGKAAVSFDGLPATNGDVLNGTVDLDASKTIFFVAKDTGTTINIGGVFTHDGGPNGVWSSSGDAYVVDWPGGGTGNSANTTAPINTYSIISAKYDNTNGTISIFQDGVAAELLTTPRGTAGSVPFYIGSRTHTGEPDYSRYYNGELAEILVYDGVLTGKDEAAVGRYLAAKYGLGFALNFETRNPYARRVLNQGATTYYRFEQNAGNVAMDSAGDDVAQNGVFINTTTLSTDTPGTIGGTSVQLNGTSSYIDAARGGGDLIEGATWTASLWIKPDAPMQSLAGLVSKAQNMGEGVWPLGIRRSSTTTNIEWMQNSDGLDTGFAAPVGEWSQVVAVFDAAVGRRFYVNGRLQAADGHTRTVAANNDPLLIGNDYRPGSGRHFSGLMDEVALYDRPLSSARVLEQYYQAFALPYGDGQTRSFRRGENGYAGAADARLVSAGWADRNFGAVSDILGVGSWNSPPHTDRGVLRFDLSGLSDGMTRATGDATLMLTVSLNQSFEGQRIELFAIDPANAGWIEGVNTGGGANTGEATWNSRNHNLAAWVGGPGLGSPGAGGYDVDPLDYLDYNGEELVYFTIPEELINSWIADPASNAGLLLRAGDESTSFAHRLFFYPSDAADIESRPLLVFNTAIPEPTSLLLLGGGLLALARRRRRRKGA